MGLNLASRECIFFFLNQIFMLVAVVWKVERKFNLHIPEKLMENICPIQKTFLIEQNCIASFCSQALRLPKLIKMIKAAVDNTQYSFDHFNINNASPSEDAHSEGGVKML